MLLRIACLATRFPRTLLICGFVLAVGCAMAGITVASHLESGGFVNDRAESQIANNIMATDFQGAAPNFVLVVDTEHGVTTPAVRERAQHIVDYLLSRHDIAGVQSYWTSNPRMGSRLRSADGRYGLIVAHIVGNESQIQTIAGAVTSHVAGTRDGATVRAGGVAASYHEMITQITKDLEIAEGFAIPITLVVLILVFGSLVAAVLPLLLGLFAMAVTLAILRLFTLFSDVSIFAMNITTALGLAVAIDYSLFLVSRFREELAGGHPPTAAAIRTVQTAGRTVLFSALTVCLSMAVLSVFDMYFLRSIAVSAVAVVAAAAVSAIVLLPAALVLLGTRVNALDLRAFVRRTFTDRPPSVLLPPEQTRWYRTVHWVMRHAAPVGLLLVVLLVAVAGPFLGAKFGYPDDRIFRGPVASRQAGDVMRSQFPQVDPAAQTTIVLPNFHDPTALADYARALSQVDHVQAVESASGVFLAGNRVAAAPLAMANEHGTFLQITSDLDPFSPRGHAQLNALRAVPAPARTLFAGTAALNADSLRALSSRMPVAAVLIALTTLVVLFLFTGSVLLPLKTLVLTTLSLSAAFGAMVWIFQDGHWAGLFGIAPTGYLVPTIPIMMFCIGFGLSMDYEVFLLSRIREEWLRRRAVNPDPATAKHDNIESVAIGVARTGRIFTAAAILMAIVIGAMATSRVAFLQLLGAGMTLTVLVDATLIRGLLAPALMRLMGPANWWAPKPLARLHARIALSEQPPEPAETPQPAGVGHQ